MPSGEFEDYETLTVESWKAEQSMLDSVESSAELSRIAKQGLYSLHLTARTIEGEVPPTKETLPAGSAISTAAAGDVIVAIPSAAIIYPKFRMPHSL